MELNSQGRPILPIKIYEGDDLIVDAQDLLEWQRSFIEPLDRMTARLADPVEMVAEAIYRTEPKPPGRPSPPFGSFGKNVWEPYREKARAFLSVSDTGAPDAQAKD